jgi:hypothetical protein
VEAGKPKSMVFSASGESFILQLIVEWKEKRACVKGKTERGLA